MSRTSGAIVTGGEGGAFEGDAGDIDFTPASGIAATDVQAAVVEALTDAQAYADGAVADHEGAADPHSVYQKESEKAQANGYASLDGDGLVPDGQIPSGITRDSELTAAVSAAIDDLLDGAPSALNTLAELAAAIGDDASFASTVTTALAGKQPLDADLTAIAALTTTSYGRSVLETASAAALRTLAGVAIGSDVQAYSAHLAALVTAANSATLAAVTSAFTTAQATKLSGIETAADVTDAANVDAAGAVMEADYNAHGFLAATADNTPTNRTVSEEQVVGRVTGGNIEGLNPSSIAQQINTQTDDYTLVLADRGKIVEMNCGDADALTVPPNSSVAFPVGTRIDVVQYGAGAITLTPGGGVTIRRNALLTLVTNGQYSGCTLYKRATDEWVAVGDLVPA